MDIPVTLRNSNEDNIHTRFRVDIHCGAGSQGNTTIICIGLLNCGCGGLLLKFSVLEFLVLEAFLEEFESFLKERERISRVGLVLQRFDVAGERLCRVAEQISTCNGLAVREHVADARLDCPYRDLHGWGCASKQGRKEK
jgi:hypothetical protein